VCYNGRVGRERKGKGRKTFRGGQEGSFKRKAGREMCCRKERLLIREAANSVLGYRKSLEICRKNMKRKVRRARRWLHKTRIKKKNRLGRSLDRYI
jgi:hypothetical protein